MWALSPASAERMSDPVSTRDPKFVGPLTPEKLAAKNKDDARKAEVRKAEDELLRHENRCKTETKRCDDLLTGLTDSGKTLASMEHELNEVKARKRYNEERLEVLQHKVDRTNHEVARANAAIAELSRKRAKDLREAGLPPPSPERKAKKARPLE